MKRFLGVFFVLLLVFALLAFPHAVRAASFTVTNTNDSGPGSLRQAIVDANTNPGTDTITFNIPGAGPHTIQPLSALPIITDPVIIDGYTQTGSSPNTNGPGLGSNAVLMLELDGSMVGAEANGLHITGGKSAVRGLVINRFGSSPGVWASGIGILLDTNGGNVIEGNFIGTDATGTADLGNDFMGVAINGVTGNTIGGTTVKSRNIISGNGEAGIIIYATGNLVQGNFIGTDVTGTANLGNGGWGVAILFNASNNIIGGTTPEARNVISGNDGDGVVLVGEGIKKDNLVQGNFIGTDVTGTAALGNSRDGVHINGASDNIIGGMAAGAGNLISGNSLTGVSIVNATGNLVQGNTITSNGAAGVRVGDVYGNIATGSAILSNSIFSNAGLGIDLGGDGMTLNDPGDTDSGANNLQNFPVLTSATSGSTTIEGTLNSTPNTKFRLEFFANTECDPSGYGEGETFLGFIDVTIDGSGNVAFTVTFPDTVPGGHFITATATDPNSNTSEFSQCLQVIAAPAEVWVNDDYAPGEYNDGHTWGYDAFAKIQDGMDAVAGSIVHVAAGYYVENIILADGVQVLGAGADVTIIDGGGSGSVVTAIDVGSDTVLDGFTITGGVADVGGGMYNYESSPAVTNCNFYNNSAYDSGGGMYNVYCSPTVNNCMFTSNFADWGGGGMCNRYSSPTISNCTFANNYANSYGGGIRNASSSPAISKCTFWDNSASIGGGMYNYDRSSPVITNCIFFANSARGVDYGGGGMCNYSQSSPTVTNCTLVNNSANAHGGGIFNAYSSAPTVINCILWDNGEEIYPESSTHEVSYSDIQGGYSGEGNIDADPMFVDPAGGDYHLELGSPCIDSGTNTGAPDKDIEGNDRPIDGDGDNIAVTDMGAYEYVPPAVVVEATMDFNPNTLNLKSKGKWITCYIELPEGYDVEEIDISTVMLNDIVPALAHPTGVGDYDSDGVFDLMVKFDRSDVQDVLEPGNEVEVTVSGQLTDGTSFEGADTIRVIAKGKK